MNKISHQKKSYLKPACAMMAVQNDPLLQQISRVRVGDRLQIEGAADQFEGIYDIKIADKSHSAWGEVEVD